MENIMEQEPQESKESTNKSVNDTGAVCLG